MLARVCTAEPGRNGLIRKVLFDDRNEFDNRSHINDSAHPRPRPLREGGNHSICVNRTAAKTSAVPRHAEINDDLAKKIRHQRHQAT